MHESTADYHQLVEKNDFKDKTCERGVVDKRVRLLIRGSAQGTSLRTDPHGRCGWRSGRMRWKMSGESKRIKTLRTTTWNMGDMMRNTPWANVTCDTVMSAVKLRENVTCEVCCSHPPSVAADCHQMETMLLQLKKKIMSSTSVQSTATMRYWKKKKTNATFGIDKKGLVQVALLQICGGDGS